MSRQSIFLWSIIGLTSCGQNNQIQPGSNNVDSTVDTTAVINDPKNNLNIKTNRCSEIDSSGILMFPLSMGESDRDGGSSYYKEMPEETYWNIIFLNSKTNEYHLLSNRKMLINNYDFKNYGDDNLEKAQPKKHVFYSIITSDFNKDKKLTYTDPQYLFVSDKQGKNFRQISPSNYDLQNWQFIKSTNKVLMFLRKDSDKNNEFNEKDEVATFEIDVDKKMEAREIFSQDFKNKLKILFDKDWKRIKK